MDVRVDSEVTEGDNVIVECDARGGNPPVVDSYQWALIPKYEELNVTFICDTRECVIEAVKPQHSGVYNCTASNWDGYYTIWNTASMTVKCELPGWTTVRVDI